MAPHLSRLTMIVYGNPRRPHRPISAIDSTRGFIKGLQGAASSGGDPGGELAGIEAGRLAAARDVYDTGERRRLHGATRPRDGAARVEGAARGRRERARRLAGERNPLPPAGRVR